MLSWLFRNRIFLFIWATITGFLFALVWKQYEQTIHETLTYYRIAPSSFDYQWAYRLWLSNLGFRSAPKTNNLTVDRTLKQLGTGKGGSHTMQESAWLREKVPIFCIVMTKKLQQAKAVKNTWSRHCNRALFYGPFNDAAIPVNKIAAKDSWAVLCDVLSKVWKGYNDEFKWVLLTGDRTYAIVENLRYMVASLDHNQSHYLGHTYHDYDGQYNIDDAGYVISWQVMQLLSNKFPDQQSCARSEYWQGGGRTLGKVLEEVGVKPKDTRDIMERSRFLSFGLDKLLIPGGISVFSRYWRDSVFLSPEGSGCCSDFVITFSDIPADKMYMMEYIVYHLKPVSHYWPLSTELNVSPNTVSEKPSTQPPSKPTGKGFVAELTGKQKKSVTKKSLSLSKETDVESPAEVLKNLLKRLKEKSGTDLGVKTNLLEEDDNIKSSKISKILSENDGIDIDEYDAVEMEKEKDLKTNNDAGEKSKVDSAIKAIS